MAAAASRSQVSEQRPGIRAELSSGNTIAAELSQLSDDESKRLVRVTVLFTPDEADAIDEWRHANRRPTRSDAVRSMIRHVLESGINLRHMPKPRRTS